MAIENNQLQIKEADQFREEALDVLRNNDDLGSIKDDQYSFNYAFFAALGVVMEDYVEERLTEVYNSGTIVNAHDEHLTRKAEEFGVYRNEAAKATGVVEFYREDDVAPTDLPIEEGTTVQTATDEPLRYETTEAATLVEGDDTVWVNVEAIEGGAEYNIPMHRATVMPSPPSGIDGATNPLPIGDNSYSDNNGDNYQKGTNREDDEELRTRVFDTYSFGSNASEGGIRNTLLELESVEDARVITNPTPNPSNNLDPFSSEVLVKGGSNDAIAEALYDTMSVTDLLRLQNGQNGDSRGSIFLDAVTAEDNLLIPISSPIERQLTIELTYYYDDAEYVGDDEIKDNIVEYVGGTKVDGSYFRGLNIGDDVLVDQIQSNIVDSVDCNTGVFELANDNAIEITTPSGGLFVDTALPVEDNELATVDATDITINSNARNY